MHGHIVMLESKLLASNKHSQTGFALLVKGCTGSLCRSPIDSDVSQQFANIPVHYWRAFLERPETFRADFGHDIIQYVYILKTKTFLIMKLYYTFNISYLKDVVRMSGSYF